MRAPCSEVGLVRKLFSLAYSLTSRLAIKHEIFKLYGAQFLLGRVFLVDILQAYRAEQIQLASFVKIDAASI
jgi:hypothetical protein